LNTRLVRPLNFLGCRDVSLWLGCFFEIGLGESQTEFYGLNEV